MPIYEEKRLHRRKSILYLAIAFLIIYMPFQIGSRELRWDEVYYSQMALEMNLFKPNTFVHGEVISGNYPLFPWIASIFFKAGATPELGLRLVSVLSVLAMLVLAWEAARRALDLQAASVSAALLMSSILFVDKSLDGYPNTLGLLFIFAAWIAWFMYGPVRGSWNMAWFISFLFCGFSFYAIGWFGVFIFCLPLLFMRRPMTIWSRLNKPGLYLGLCCLGFFILIWGMPRWMTGSDIPFRNIPIKPDNFGDYLEHLVIFPFEFALRIFPLSLFAWPAFCAAYSPLDRNPVFSRFLRTISVSIFFFLWFYPLSNVRDYIILVPPLAILAGMNYWLLARRLGFQLHAIFKIIAYTGLACAIGAVLFYLVPVKWWSDFIMLRKGAEFRDASFAIGLSFSISALVLVLIILKAAPSKCALWLHCLGAICAAALLYWASMNPYQSYDKKQQDVAHQIREMMGDDFHKGMTIYKEQNIGLYAMSTYLQCSKDEKFPWTCSYDKIRIRKIQSYKDIQAINEEVFIFSDDVPVMPGRTFKKIAVNEEKKIYLYKFSRPAAPTGTEGK